MANKTIPAISIVIPMYNTEKYIGECLDSILAQTFQDFEVIIADNCSTDNSTKVVERYLKKRSQIQLVRTKFHADGAGIPRNTAIGLSRGEYIFFMDSDDAIVEDALEKIYTTALKFKPDVIHCGKWYQAPEETVTTDKNVLKENLEERGYNFKEPTLETNNLEERIIKFANQGIWWVAWNQIINRNFLMEQGFKFQKISPSEDFLFTLNLLCTAKNFLHYHEPYYVWRKRKDSTSQTGGLNFEGTFKRYIKAILNYVNWIDSFMNEFEIFKNNPKYKYAVFDFYLNIHLGNCLPVYSQIPAYQLDSLIRQELEQIQDKTALTAFLFNSGMFLMLI